MASQSQLMHHILERLAGIECLLSQVHYKVFEAQMYGFDTLAAETRPEIFHNSFANINSTLSSSHKRRLRSKRAKSRRSAVNKIQEEHVHIPVGQHQEHSTKVDPLDNGCNQSNTTMSQSLTQPLLADCDLPVIQEVACTTEEALGSVVNVANVSSSLPLVADAPLAASSSHMSSSLVSEVKVANVANTTFCAPRAPRRCQFAPRRLRQTDQTRKSALFSGLPCSHHNAGEVASDTDMEEYPDHDDNFSGGCDICGFQYLEFDLQLISQAGGHICEACFLDEGELDCEAGFSDDGSF